MKMNRVKLIRAVVGLAMLAAGWLVWRALTATILESWSSDAKGMTLMIGGFVYVVFVMMVAQIVADKTARHRSR